MAAGDIVFFDDVSSWGDFLDGWAGTDDIKIAIIDNTTTPAATDANPVLANYTQVTTAGTYSVTSIGTWAAIWSQSVGTGTMDSVTNPSWAADALNDTDAYWAIGYNDTQTGDPCIFFVDLGGPYDMTAGTLSITWNDAGIATQTKA